MQRIAPRSVSFIAAALTAGASAAQIQSPSDSLSDQATLTEPGQPSFRVEITPRIHLLSPAGAFHINGSQRIPMRFAQLDDQRLAPGWHARVNLGEYHVETEGFALRIAGRARNAAVLAPSVPITGFARSEMQFTSADLRLGRDIYDHRFRSADGQREVLRATLSPRVGLHLVDTSFSVEQITNPSLRDDSTVTLLEPTIGIAGRLVFEEQFVINSAIDVGIWPDVAGVESSSASISVGLGYQLDQHVTFRGGYRLLVQNINDEGSLELDGSIAGVFVGFSVRF